MSEHDAGDEEMPPLVAEARDVLRAFIECHWLRPTGPPDEAPGQAQQPPE